MKHKGVVMSEALFDLLYMLSELSEIIFRFSILILIFMFYKLKEKENK